MNLNVLFCKGMLASPAPEERCGLNLTVNLGLPTLNQFIKCFIIAI